MSKVIASVVSFVSSLPVFADIVAKIVSLSWKDIQKLGELAGFNPDDDTLRDNRDRQVTTDKLIGLLSEKGKPRWNPTVGTIYIRADAERLPAVVNGGNTFRAIYWYLQANQNDTVPVTLKYSTKVDFGAFDQIGKDRDGKVNLATRFADGYSELYHELFGLSCLRVKGKGVNGGGQTKSTWKDKVWLPDDIASNKGSMFDEPWFNALYSFTIAKSSTNQQSVLSLGELLSETMPKGKFKQMHIAYLAMVCLDLLGDVQAWDVDEKGNAIALPTLSALIESIYANLATGSKLLLPTFAPTTKGMTVKPEPKYSALLNFVQCCKEGTKLPSVLKTDSVPPLGSVKAFESFEKALTEDENLRKYYSTK